jgi:hypothetical protein
MDIINFSLSRVRLLIKDSLYWSDIAFMKNLIVRYYFYEDCSSNIQDTCTLYTTEK